MTPESDAVQLPLAPPQIPPTVQKQAYSPIRVLLVDDHAMVRQGLRTLLESYGDVEIAGEASNGAEAVEMVERLQPSVVVMDINMPIRNGIKATEKIKSRCRCHYHWIVTSIGWCERSCDEKCRGRHAAQQGGGGGGALKAICETVGRRHE